MDLLIMLYCSGGIVVFVCQFGIELQLVVVVVECFLLILCDVFCVVQVCVGIDGLLVLLVECGGVDFVVDIMSVEFVDFVKGVVLFVCFGID